MSAEAADRAPIMTLRDLVRYTALTLAILASRLLFLSSV